MRKLPFAAAWLAVAFSTPALAQDTEERLVSPDLPGFAVAYAAANDTQSIREEIPAGETTQAWTRLVTTQRFTGLAQRVTPKDYARRIISSMRRRCPKSQASDTRSLKVGGREAFMFQVDCPRGATGRKEAFVLLAVAGTSDMHVKQAAFRGQAIHGGLGWGRSFLRSTVFCPAGDQQGLCRP